MVDVKKLSIIMIPCEQKDGISIVNHCKCSNNSIVTKKVLCPIKNTVLPWHHVQKHGINQMSKKHGIFMENVKNIVKPLWMSK